VAVTQRGRLVALRALGKFVYQNEADGAAKLNLGEDFNRQVTPATLFDLASLTKPLATTTMAMLLYERGIVELDAPVVRTIPELASKVDPRHREITFRMLLAHSSGLPAYEKLFLKAHTPHELLHAAFGTPLAADPGSRAEYSDIGFIILGIALERLAGESLDVFCQREIFGRLGMLNTTFNPVTEIRPKIPPTADERDEQSAPGAPAGEVRETHGTAAKARSTFRNRIIQGEVQDENASVLGGIAGHAGLFCTAEDVARFAHVMIQCGAGAPSRAGILRPGTIELFTRRESTPAGTTRTLGWDTPSTPSQSGKYFGPRSYGHLGYTGTSLWIDPDRELSVTLLTNRTWPDCSNQAIKQVRPQFHDAVIETLDP
jgi:CubicO group peptidase (beta-lactamase class C family)